MAACEAAEMSVSVVLVGHLRRQDSSGALEGLQCGEPLPDFALLQSITHEQKEGEDGTVYGLSCNSRRVQHATRVHMGVKALSPSV